MSFDNLSSDTTVMTNNLSDRDHFSGINDQEYREKTEK